MHKLFENKGIVSGGILNLSPLKACKKGAIIVDVHEDYMNSFKVFDINEIIFYPYRILGDNSTNFTKDTALIFANATVIHSKEAVLF